MPWNGSGSFTRGDGVFTGTTIWAQNKTAGVKITTSRHDTHDEDLADGIEACLTKNGENYPSADLPMNGQKHTGVGVGTARTHYAAVSQIQDSGTIWGGTSSGAANTYAISLTPAISAYSNGQRFAFKSHQSNTSSVTLAVNGLTAKAIRKTDGVTALTSGDIANGQVVYVVYDAGDYFVILNRQPLDFLTTTQLKFTSAGYNLLGGTSNGTDTASFTISSADAIANGRSARITGYGTDHASNAGQLRLVGDGGGIFLETVTSSFVDISIAGNSTWTFESDGDLANNSSTGGNLVFNKTASAPILPVTTGISGAGTDQAGATAIANTINDVTTVGANSGVRLPSITTGKPIFIGNRGANTLKVYPASGHQIMTASTDAAIQIPSGYGGCFIPVSSTVWFAMFTTP